MLIIGNFALSVTQAQAQMALWSVMAAPSPAGVHHQATLFISRAAAPPTIPGF